MKKEPKVKIEVTLEQAKIIAEALDWSARTSMGQLGSSYLPGDIERQLCGDHKTDENWLYRRDVWDSFADGMTKLLHPDLIHRGSHKSYSHSDFCKNCCSINKMLEVKLQKYRYKDNPDEEPLNVNSSFCDIYDVPVAKVEIE